MENGKIGNDQISASSHYNGIPPSFARLNRIGKGWAAGSRNTNQWLQVDFQQTSIITGISTQGLGPLNQYVTAYKISFSNNGNNFDGYKAGGVLKVK